MPKRTITKIERIVYVFTQDEVIKSLSTGREGLPCGEPHRFTFKPDGSVEFIYDFVEPAK
jgi:hypothetical protein